MVSVTKSLQSSTLKCLSFQCTMMSYNVSFWWIQAKRDGSSSLFSGADVCVNVAHTVACEDGLLEKWGDTPQFQKPSAFPALIKFRRETAKIWPCIQWCGQRRGRWALKLAKKEKEELPAS